MNTNSIQTEYQDEGDLPCSAHFSLSSEQTKKEMSPSSCSITFKIQENIKQYQDQIKKNKNTISQLESQRKFFCKLSEKQKEKISQINVQQIRTAYDSKIFEVKQELSQLHEVIATLHQQEQQMEGSYMDTYSKIIKNKEFLMDTLLQLQKQNDQIAGTIAESSNEIKHLATQIQLNQNTIYKKQIAQRKYLELQIQIQRIENSMRISPSKKKT